MDAKLLEILRCPIHPEGPPLLYRDSMLVCQIDGMGFLVRDGIPNMLIEDAVPADQVQQMTAALPPTER